MIKKLIFIFLLLWTSAFAADTGLTNPTVGTTADLAGSTMTWGFPTTIVSSNDIYATAAPGGSGAVYSNYLVAQHFNFTIPTGSTIVGIIAKIERKTNTQYGGYPKDYIVSIMKSDGTVGATNKASATQYTTSDVVASYGANNDLWGETWTAEDINDDDFGFALSAQGTTCFGKGTKVKTSKGDKNIEDIVVGDMVLSRSLDENVYSEVIETFYHPKEESQLLVVINNHFEVTQEHPLWLNGEWQPAISAKVGDILKDSDWNDVEITDIKLKDKKEDTYNFEVANTHNYYANDILVHNKAQTQSWVDNMQIQVYYTAPYSGSVTITEE